MVGILIMSHGEFASGTLHSLKMFMGGQLEKVEALCLGYDEDPKSYANKIEEAYKRLDDGSGVIGLCDLAGGTPGNICTGLANDRFQVVLGYNIGFALELLGKRFSADDVSEIDISDVISTSKDRFVSLNKILFEDYD